MASEEEYIKKLEEIGLTKEEIESKVKEAISKMKGWIDHKTALFVVAKEMGIEVDSQAIKQSSEKDYTIAELSESTQNVNVVGRVIGFSDVRSFNRKDGSIGYFSSFHIFDGKDQIKAVLWDERSKIVKDNSFAKDILVRILNGQVKSNRDQKLEIHIGSRSDVEISPSDVNPANYSSLDYSKYKVKISKITPTSSINKEMISVDAVVDQVYSKRTVKSKSTNEDLSVQRIIIKDDSGSIPVVFWNEDTKLIENVQEGTKISLDNLSARPQFNDATKMELSFKNGSRLKIIKKGQPPKPIPIEEVSISSSRVTISGEVVLKNDVKIFNRKSDNSEGKVQRIQVQDTTGSIGRVFWEDDTDQLTGIEVGFKIKLENMGVQADFRDPQKMELVFRSSSKLSVLSKSSPSILDSITPIQNVLEKEGIYSIEGQIIQIGDLVKTITTSDGRALKIFSVHISDNTGAIQLTFWEEHAETYSDLSVGENIRVSRVNVKKNLRTEINNASFGKSSQLERNIDFELTEEHTVPDFHSQNQFSSPPMEVTSISEVLEKEGYYTIEGQIIQIEEGLRSITTSDGRSLNLFSIHVSDNTGAIQLTFWEDQAELYSDLSVGENIRAEGVRVKMNIRLGINSASFGKNSSLVRDIDFKLTSQYEVPSFSSFQSSSIVQFKGIYTSISDIEQEGTYEIKGNITNVKRINAYEACSQCLKNISAGKENCNCEGGSPGSVFRLIISAEFSDGTGEIPITFFGDDATKLIRVDALTIFLKKQDEDYSEFESQIIEKLMLEDLVVIGQVSPNKFSQTNEMKVRDFKSLDIEDEDSINDLIDDIEN